MSNFNLVTDARLARGSYSSNNQSNTEIIDGWRPVYVDPEDVKFSPTFGAQLYKNDAGQYKVVYRGTEGNLADWAQNFKYGTFQWSDEFRDTVAFMAKAVAQIARAEFKGDLREAASRFTTTGHSQGGFEAELAALMFGIKGTSLDGMGASGVVAQFRAELNQVMQENGVGELIRTDAVLTLKPEDYLTRIYTAVGRLGVHAGETDGAWTWSAVKLVAVFNPALTGAAVAGSLRAHLIADIVANEELRERSPLWQLIGDAGDTNYFGSPQQLAQSVAGDWASTQSAGLGGAGAELPDSSHIEARVREFLEERAGQQFDQQKLGNNVLVRTESGDGFMVYADGRMKVLSKVGDTTTVLEYERDNSLLSARQERPDGLGNTLVNEQGPGFEGSMTVTQAGQILRAQSNFYTGTTLTTSVEVHAQTLPNGQTATLTETTHHLAKGNEIASSKELVTQGGARILNTETAEGHLEEITFGKDPATGEIVRQSSKVLNYSASERTVASAEVALAGLDLMQALRAGNKLQAAASLVRLVNNAQIAANQEPVLGAVGTGLSGAVAIVSALDQWGDASDGQRIALAARTVLGANDVAKAFSADGKTGFLESSVALGALQGVIALSSLQDVLESGNPFAIASTFMSLANSAAAMAAASTATAATATTAAAAGAGSVSSAAIFGPQAMIAVAICSVVFGSVFEVEYPDPPPAGTVEIGRLADGTLGLLIRDQADGEVHQTRRLDGQVVSDSAKPTDTLDWGLGAQVLSQRMGEVIGALQAQADATGGHMVLERLPALDQEEDGITRLTFPPHARTYQAGLCRWSNSTERLNRQRRASRSPCQ